VLGSVFGRDTSCPEFFVMFLNPTRKTPVDRTAQTQNKSTQTSMTKVGFETTIPVFEWAKMFHASGHVVTVIGYNGI
jgi:hypothetical protein